jgi:hypothetical protein
MDLDRAAKFGSVGAVGVVFLSLSSSVLMAMAWNDRISGSEGTAIGTVMLVGIAGTAVTVLFLFVVIGAFLDRELEARGLDEPDE